MKHTDTRYGRKLERMYQAAFADLVQKQKISASEEEIENVKSQLERIESKIDDLLDDLKTCGYEV